MVVDSRVVERSLSTADLAQKCIRETHQFFHHQTSESRSCLEMFRRAIVLHDDLAWQTLYELYQPLILSWIRRYGSAFIFEPHESLSLVNAALAKFYQALTDRWDVNNSVAGLLNYLKDCTQSAILQSIQDRRYQNYEVSLDEGIDESLLQDDPAIIVESMTQMAGLWHTVENELHDEQERMLLRLYIEDMKPSEMSRQYPHLFPTTNDVYRIKHRLLTRLRRNQQLHLFMQGKDTLVEEPPHAREQRGRQKISLSPQQHAQGKTENQPHSPKPTSRSKQPPKVAKKLPPLSSFPPKNKNKTQIAYHLQKAFCRKALCRKCREGIGHGPYWYAYEMVDGRTKRTYIGKQLPEGIQQPLSVQASLP